MIPIEAEADDLLHIVANLRESDKRELRAAGATLDQPEAMVAGVLSLSPGFAWVVKDGDGVPVAAFGLSATTADHMMNAWAYGTDRFKRAVPLITKLQPLVAEKAWGYGVRRIQAASHALHHEAHGWLESGMGFRFEGVMKSFGCDGSDFMLYGLTEFGPDSRA